MRKILTLLLVCASAPALAEPVSKAERAWIVDYVTNTFRDPYSLRSTGISEVRPLTGVRSGICVRYNAKNAVGAYAGIDTLVFVRTERGLVYGDWRQGVSTATCRDDAVTYVPFPELAAIK